MTDENPLLSAWAAGRTTFGLWSMVPSWFGAELVARAGFDYVCVDQQHGVVDYNTMAPMVQAIGHHSMPITRVPSNDAAHIGKALDAGALGVVVPMVNTPEEAERAVAACHYPPNGIRSFGPIRANLMRGSFKPSVLDQVACIVMIETAQAVDRLDEILKVPGIDAVYIGPADLAIGLGQEPNFARPPQAALDAIESIRQGCERHGIVAGVQANDGKAARAYADRGFRMVTVVTDGSLLQRGGKEQLQAARGVEAEDAAKTAGGSYT